MLARRLRRRAIITSALDQSLVFTRMQAYIQACTFPRMINLLIAGMLK